MATKQLLVDDPYASGTSSIPKAPAAPVPAPTVTPPPATPTASQQKVSAPTTNPVATQQTQPGQQYDPLAFAATQSVSNPNNPTMPVQTQPATPTAPSTTPSTPTPTVPPVAAVQSYQYPTTNPEGGSYYTGANAPQAPVDANPMAGLSEQELEAYYTGLWGAQPGWAASTPEQIAAATAKVNSVKQANADAQAAYQQAQTPQNLDEWWAQHGNGPRYSVVNGTVVDAAQMTYNGIMQGNGAGMTPEIQASYGVSDVLNQSLKDAEAAQQAAWEYGQTHGGFAPPGYGGVGTGSPNDQPLYQNPNVPDAPFTDANGDPATQGGYAPGSPLYTGGGTTVGAPPGYADADPTKPYDPSKLTPNDTGTPSSGVGGGSAVVGGGDAGASTAPGGSDSLAPNVTPTDPNNDLRSMQITPGSLLDRFKLAQQQYGTYSDSTNPQYLAALRDATRAAAGAGRLGSGMLRTSYGDLANTRAQSLQNERDTLFQNALLGSVQDAQTQFQDLLQEQGYQSGAQNQAFNQNVTAQQLQEQLTSGAFQRALQQAIQGNSGNPSDALLQLSKTFGDQSSAAGQVLAQLMQGLAAGGNTTQTQDLLQQLLAYYQQGSQSLGNTTVPKPSSTTTSPGAMV